VLDPSVFGRSGSPTLIVSATLVRTGEARLFCDAEVTVDALLASACLPQLFPAVEIDGEAYWDGGYSSNLPLRPLIEAGAPADVIFVRTAPVEQTDIPRSPGDIQARTTELGFRVALRQELRSLAVAQHLLADLPSLSGPLARLRDARLHIISAEQEGPRAQGKRKAISNLGLSPQTASARCGGWRSVAPRKS
jgi:NTE family protein